MYFTKVELHNFGIYKGTHTMCLTDQTGERNITLIGGLNGRGKTTFHDAILLALYGKQALTYVQEKVRSYDKLLLDHVNKYATDPETYVAVSLCLDDGTHLRVKRAWTVKGQRVIQQLVAEKNGVVDKYLGENWSYYIEEILPFGIARFFFFNNEKITQLADDTSFEQIKSSIRSAIGVSTIERAIDHAAEVIRRKQTALAAFEHSEEKTEYQAVDEQIDALDSRIADVAQQVQALECRREAMTSALEKKEQEFWACGGELGRSREAIKLEIKTITAEVKHAQTEILQQTVDAATPLFLCRDLVARSYAHAQDFRQSETRRHTDRIIADLHRNILQRLAACGLCAADQKTVKTIIDDVLAESLSADAAGRETIPVSAAGLVLYQRLIAEVFPGTAQRITLSTEQLQAQECALASLDAHLGAASEKTPSVQLLDELRSLEAEKAVADAEYVRQQEALDNLIHQQETLAARRNQLLKKIAEKECAHDDDARIIKYATMSIDVLTAFKTRLQREKVAKLSATVTDCFHELVEKDSLVRTISIDPDTLDVAIWDADGKELFKSQLSAGEQQMFAVAIVWALALTSGYKAPVVIDTPMARLDSSHRVNFVTKYLPAASSQVLVLSTDEEVYGRYLELIRDHVAQRYTLLYREEERCTSIVHGYFGEE